MLSKINPIHTGVLMDINWFGKCCQPRSVAKERRPKNSPMIDQFKGFALSAKARRNTKFSNCNINPL